VISFVSHVMIAAPSIPVECPRCNYTNETRLREVQMQSQIFCANCKATIQLLDDAASLHRGTKAIDDALNDLLKAFKF